MTDMILLSEAQMARISPFFPLSHGIPRVDDRRVISGIIFVIRNGLRWRDVPPSYGPHKTIYNRFIRWSELGVFGRIFVELAKSGGETAEMMIDATHLKAHRTAASLLKRGLFPGISDAPRAA
jgi:putative transposase